MTITREPPDDGGSAPTGSTPPGLTLDAIQAVRDFTARKTLEQAHALVTGLRRVLDEGPGADPALVRDLAIAGIGAREAEQIAVEAIAMMEAMADRDRKAEAFEAAVQEASRRERAIYERLSALAAVLREELGGRPEALAQLGVPSPAARLAKARPRPAGKAIYSAVAAK